MKTQTFFLKVIVLILIAVMATAGIMFGQTGQESKQVKALENEIKKTKKEIISLKNREYLNFVDSAKLMAEAEIIAKQKKIVYLEQQRDKIFDRYTTTEKLSGEIGRYEFNRRQRSENLRRQELVLQKIEANMSSVNPSQSGTSKAGYKVILENKYVLPVTFVIQPLNGGETKSVMLSSGTKGIIYLIPGSYTVSFMKNGNGEVLGPNRNLRIDGSEHLYDGENCFGFAFTSRF